MIHTSIDPINLLSAIHNFLLHHHTHVMNIVNHIDDLVQMLILHVECATRFGVSILTEQLTGLDLGTNEAGRGGVCRTTLGALTARFAHRRTRQRQTVGAVVELFGIRFEEHLGCLTESTRTDHQLVHDGLHVSAHHAEAGRLVLEAHVDMLRPSAQHHLVDHVVAPGEALHLVAVLVLHVEALILQCETHAGERVVIALQQDHDVHVAVLPVLPVAVVVLLVVLTVVLLGLVTRECVLQTAAHTLQAADHTFTAVQIVVNVLHVVLDSIQLTALSLQLFQCIGTHLTGIQRNTKCIFRSVQIDLGPPLLCERTEETTVLRSTATTSISATGPI
mmetsp:Transcript_745/g.1719  ORF Transcript_745/g.1719 Transcript_745/m.1719 type:complete len:334 (+) Transcript_745:100-1101(+)